MKFVALILLMMTFTNANAGISSSRMSALKNMRAKYVKAGGSPKAFDQLQCFAENYGQTVFQTRKDRSSGMASRCSNKRLSVQNDSHMVIIDYTKTSNQPRFFILNLKTQTVKALYTSHGRYGKNTPRSNSKVSRKPPMNSIRQAVYFSNEPGMNATAGGFYLTGEKGSGRYGRLVVLHGLERGFNDNACNRAVIIHRSGLITAKSTNIMSSGCPMVSNEEIQPVANAVAGGALLYMYTPNEAALPADRCGRNLLIPKVEPLN